MATATLELATSELQETAAETASQQRLLQVRNLWNKSQADQLEIGRLLYEERAERFAIGGRGIHEGFHQWLRDAGIPKTSAYRRIAEYEISIGERTEEDKFDKPKPVPPGTSCSWCRGTKGIPEEGEKLCPSCKAAATDARERREPDADVVQEEHPDTIGEMAYRLDPSAPIPSAPEEHPEEIAYQPDPSEPEFAPLITAGMEDISNLNCWGTPGTEYALERLFPDVFHSAIGGMVPQVKKPNVGSNYRVSFNALTQVEVEALALLMRVGGATIEAITKKNFRKKMREHLESAPQIMNDLEILLGKISEAK